MLDKKEIKFNGYKYWLLFQDEKGINYWLEEPSWSCGWYWGFGYIETFTNNKCPQRSADIASHNHFDTMFLGSAKDTLKFIKAKSPFNNKEVWQILELMQSYYALKKIAGFYATVGERLAKIHCDNLVKDNGKSEEINKIILPSIFEEIKNILRPKEKV